MKQMMRLFLSIACLVLCVGFALAQKGKADSDFYPMGYSGETWTGEVTTFDNDKRTLTMVYGEGKKATTFVASIPDAPYQWTKDISKSRVLDFPYNKAVNIQLFKYQGPGGAATFLPESISNRYPDGMQNRPNPPDANRIDDFADFQGRKITVYYTVRGRKEGGLDVKYNDVWRVYVWPKKK